MPSITVLQAGFLTPAQIASSRHIMGLDTQLIEDGTYYLATIDGRAGRMRWLEPAQHALWRRPFAWP